MQAAPCAAHERTVDTQRHVPPRLAPPPTAAGGPAIAYECTAGTQVTYRLTPCPATSTITAVGNASGSGAVVFVPIQQRVVQRIVPRAEACRAVMANAAPGALPYTRLEIAMCH